MPRATDGKSYEQLLSEVESLTRQLAEAKADGDDNYIQGIQRGGLLAITAINGLLKKARGALEHGDVMVAREHMLCCEAIADAIKDAKNEQRKIDQARGETK